MDTNTTLRALILALYTSQQKTLPSHFHSLLFPLLEVLLNSPSPPPLHLGQFISSIKSEGQIRFRLLYPLAHITFSLHLHTDTFQEVIIRHSQSMEKQIIVSNCYSRAKGDASTQCNTVKSEHSMDYSGEFIT